ncbi:precorrin-3B synthase [Alloyangia pacifica]|uniref:precorrin-3B synthase n=1 Tax=Alloyangia pacifica TaxID=311180 RepID=UPI001CD6F149|nr:precorrin-3B synthase [Alloyangia pacifica]MCA0994990.1 precorrin-3B synthase [Alloyangia pacifica]
MSGAVKGWCPGAHRPMMSGDGLVVRVRPRLGRLDARQALGLCALAQRHGSGVIDLTSRANLQIRGVAEADHAPLLAGLAALGLLDASAAAERRRNILVSPFWQPGDLTERLTRALTAALPSLPELPAKVGVAIDTGAAPLLATASADVRLERSAKGLILRADGTAAGRVVTEDGAIPALIEMLRWFDARRTPERRRMAQVVAQTALPRGWQEVPPLPCADVPDPGLRPEGALIGAAFGQLDALALADVLRESNAIAIRVTPWRMLLFEGGALPRSGPFITAAGDPLLAVDACPGAPLCASATVQTRALARALAGRWDGALHVSGCAKGCARPRPARRTLVGRDGRFDLIENGRAGDTPCRTGLTPEDLETGVL